MTAGARGGRPSVLFACVHNADRSQMAAGWLAALAGDAVEVRSAGTAPAESVNPVAVRVIRDAIRVRVEELIAELLPAPGERP